MDQQQQQKNDKSFLEKTDEEFCLFSCPAANEKEKEKVDLSQLTYSLELILFIISFQNKKFIYPRKTCFLSIFFSYFSLISASKFK
jgi:hypothetical protein